MTTRLQQFREARGLTKTELATRAGVTERTVRNIERGAYDPSFATAHKLAKALGVAMEDLRAEPGNANCGTGGDA